MPNLPEKSEKEILNELLAEQDKIPVIDAESEPRLDKEVESLIHKLETDPSLTKPVTDDYGQPLVSPAAPTAPKIILPISQGSYTYGLTQKVSQSIRWLAEWCFRLIKIFGERAAFRETEGGA